MTRVAVVAVHGVADQKPAESARAVADLLCADEAKYSAFTEVPLRIARKRMEPGTPGEDDAGIDYMHRQLRDYPKADDDAGNVYETVRLEGKRKSDGADVHVHEVYWADLSRAGETWYRLLAEFYQLILHLPSLGRNGLRYAARENGGRWWSSAHQLQRFTVWLLTVPAVLLNVVMLSLGAITILAEIPHRYVAIGVATILFSGAGIGVLRALKLRQVLWATWPLVIAASFGLASVAVPRRNLFEVLAIEGTLIAAAISFFIAAKYSVMKRTAKRFGGVAIAVMAGTAAYFIVGEVTSEGTAYLAALLTAQVLYLLLVGTWILVYGVGLLAAGFGVVAARLTPKEKRAAAWRATWTARFSLGMPAALFTIFTLSIWYLIVFSLGTLAPDKAVAGQMMEMLLDATRGLAIFVIALGCFVVAALVAAIPSIALEIKPSRMTTDDESQSLGKWLSGGIMLVAVAGELFTVAFIAMLLFRDATKALPFDDRFMLLAGAGVVASLLIGKRFISTFRAAVDVLLDVDNYLRESPGDATPRARIAERFVSMLRHLSASGYDRIVIVAHSQGTVISADVLRYLRAVPDPAITKPVRLYTMGSPLRQLYAAAFPYLYSWIERSADRLHVDVWANVYRSGDYVGRTLWCDEASQARIWIRNVPAHVEPPRAEFCIGAGAHTHYWNRYARDVATYLDRLIE
jgi:hypothetical protein